MLVIQRPTVEALGEADGNRQLFAVSPLEPGFGHTSATRCVARCCRRSPVRRSRQVRFDDALHEFDTINGVTEDVTDIILNLKDLVLQSTSDEPVIVRLDVRGPAKVTAGDIQLPSDVEILNPELHIATLNQRGRLAIDLTVERGRGYLSAERPAGTSTIGIIPIDSIFSPVRRVTFSVEPTRVEQSTNYDRLVLDIETDGSITPREALASAGATLRSLVELVAEMSDEAAGPRARRGHRHQRRLARPRSCRSRTSTCPSAPQLPQARPGQHDRRARSTKSEDDLLAITNFGQKSLDEVNQKLDERGLSLRGAN